MIDFLRGPHADQIDAAIPIVTMVSLLLWIAFVSYQKNYGRSIKSNTAWKVGILIPFVGISASICYPIWRQTQPAIRVRLVDALNAGDLETMRALLDQYPQQDARDNQRNPILKLAVLKRRTDMVTLLLSKRAFINNPDRSGNTPLHVAITTRNAEIVGLLLQHGADVHQENENGISPWATAKTVGDPEILRLLKEHGAK